MCGRVIGYQHGTTDAIGEIFYSKMTLVEEYLDDVSLTHGAIGSRTHIWSFQC